MPTPTSERAASILEAILDLPPAEREARLAASCGGDPALLAEVRALIAAHESAPTAFLQAPGDADGISGSGLAALLAPAAGDSTERAGELIGRYKLLQEIGEGGFGTVWMAEQVEPVTRRVALKIIKLGMDTREVIARFEQERQALAMMDHPNIAKVLDAGATERGRPFFVMELVKGMPITQYCDEAGLGTRERLALFSDVCSAINHAHQKGIIHRDIKPSNVMVTLHGDQPVVKVIDFGIAKATQGKLTDKTLFTKYEQMIGTPAYMSPEQASLSGLDVDTRSDIYALGILLYELLTGKPPFDAKSLLSAGYEEMRRIIREVEPARPSSRLSTVAGEERVTLAKAHRIEPGKVSRMVEPDLDWIVMKAIEKDRARRYETANAFAQDIARFLADEPVSATQPGAGYRFRKFARRHKVALRVAASLAALLVAATGFSTWQAVRATRAKEEATAEASRARAAERLEAAARREAEDIATFLGDVFQSPDPERDGREIKVVELLDNAAMKLDSDLAAQPARRAKLRARLGATFWTFGLTQQAIALQEDVRDYYLAASGPEHPDTLEAMHRLALSYADAGRLDKALKLQEEVRALYFKVSGPEHPDTLGAMHNLAGSYARAGRLDEALKLQEEVLALRLRVNGPEFPDTLGALTNLASSYADAGRRNEALILREAILPHFRRVLGPEHPDTLHAIHNLAISYADAGREDEALTLRKEVLALRRKVSGPEHPDTLTAMTSLAASYSAVGCRDEAREMREEVLALRGKVSGPEHPDTLDAMLHVADSHVDAGRRDEALAMREEVLALRHRVSGPEHPGTLDAMHILAISYADAGRRDVALEMRTATLDLRRKVSGPEHPDTLTAMYYLAESYAAADREDEEIELRDELLELSRKVNGLEHPDTLTAMHSLAYACISAGRLDEAIKPGEELLKLRLKLNGPKHPETLTAKHNLASIYHDAGRRNEALEMRVEVLEARSAVHGPEHVGTLGAMTNLAVSYSAAGRLTDAVELQEKSLALKRRVLPPDHAFFAAALGHMAELYGKTGREEEAEALRQELAALLGTPPPTEARTPFPPVVATLIPPDSEWKWLHPSDGIDPAGQEPDFHATFFAPDFDDSAWKCGKDSADPMGGFGYGQGFTGLDIGRPDIETHRNAAYFRRRFTTDKAHASLELRCQRDDGLIVYLDGSEVLRDNLPAGPDAYELFATRPQGPDNDGVLHRFPLPGTLEAGEHVLAISLHNCEAPSSDLRIGGITLVETE